MATSKNAKVNRGSNKKTFLVYNGKEIEVCATKVIGSTAGLRDCQGVEDKNSKQLLLDEKGIPLIWNIVDKYEVKTDKAD